MTRFRLLIPALVLALGAAAAAASTDTPTPTPTPEPTPTASPTPYPQSTITVRFVDDQEGTTPLELILAGPIHRLLADGVDCTLDYPDFEEYIASEFTIEWPRIGAHLPNECTKGPPTTLRFEFRGPAHLPASLVVEGVWEGGDLDIAKWLPLQAQPQSPTPSASDDAPSAITPSTPAAFPVTGGAPDKALPHAGLILLALGALILFASAGVASWHSKR